MTYHWACPRCQKVEYITTHITIKHASVLCAQCGTNLEIGVHNNKMVVSELTEEMLDELQYCFDFGEALIEKRRKAIRATSPRTIRASELHVKDLIVSGLRLDTSAMVTAVRKSLRVHITVSFDSEISQEFTLAPNTVLTVY